ncbi:MAG: filamentous hemagglutinin N-terminal domain-containing protein, partial [Gammaproteobacteria bacterium]|nr:filamentous hemagglutinin N-terminal domain-containing protein [Gammaproteobacteria bacterium]
MGLSQGAPAEVTLDGTLGPAGALTGPDYVIPDTVGETHGTNLFHSFAAFNLTSSESATFTGPPGLDNVIARVTGGEVSAIDGTLAATIPGADLFLLNPSGVLLGENAQLNVGGSFFASTADYLRLADGGRFDAHAPGASTLSAAAPAAFGFLGPAAPIEVAGSLSVTPFNTLALAGGDITVSGALEAPSGRIELAAVAAAGEVTLPFADSEFAAFEALGDVTLSPGALLSTAGSPGGTIAIRGGRLVLESATLDSTNSGGRDHTGTGVDIAVRGDFEMRVDADAAAREDALIDTSSPGTARAGDIRIQAGALRMTGEAADAGGEFFVDVVSDAPSGGRSGDILVSAGEVSLGANASISSYSRDGRAGDITVNVGSLQVIGTSGSGSLIASVGEGQAQAGNLTVTADQVLLQGGSGAFAGLSIDGSGAGEATGSLSLTATHVEIFDGAQISTRTFNPTGGNIRVAADTVSIAGTDALGTAAGVYSSVTRLGPTGAGNIDIEARTLDISENGMISARLDAPDA